MAQLLISDIQKSFGETPVLKGVSLDIADGEFVSLVGPSGCGKSTLLRIIAGLEVQDAGSIWIDGTNVNGMRASQRNLSMVFQSYALYPHLTVAENIAVPLRMRELNSWQRFPLVGPFVPGTRPVLKDINSAVLEAAATLDITHLLERKPGQLSGGQRQRVAVGRALVRHPKAFLLDEPLSNLDAKLRVHMRTEIAQLHRRLAATFVYVTHDQAEAMTMSDRIAVLMDGELLQVGTPDEIYNRPVDIRVAEFIGSPKINILPAGCDANGRVTLFGKATTLGAKGTDKVAHLGVRPEAFVITNGDGDLSGTVTHSENLGSELFIQLSVADVDHPVIVRAEASLAPKIRRGSPLSVAVDHGRALAFDAKGKAVAVDDRDIWQKAVNA